MRLLISLLLALILTAPALADDWDGDQVIRKRAKKKEKTEEKHEYGEDAEDGGKPLGMYFGNGDEYLENGAPGQPKEPESEKSPESEPTEQRSAILGPRHKPPVFIDQPAPEARPEEAVEPDEAVEKETVEAAELNTDVIEAVEALEAEEAVESEEPIEFAEEEKFEAIREAETIAGTMLATFNVEPNELVDIGDPTNAAHIWGESAPPAPESGLSRYSSYPAMQGVGKSKLTAEEVEAEADGAHDHEHDDDKAEDQAGNGRRRLKSYDPDEW